MYKTKKVNKRRKGNKGTLIAIIFAISVATIAACVGILLSAEFLTKHGCISEPQVKGLTISYIKASRPEAMTEKPGGKTVEEKKEKKVVWYDYMCDANEITGASAEEFDELIEWICDYRGIKYSDCPFYGKGDVLEQIETEYNVSGVVCLGIWTWESSFGTSSMAKNRNNYGGITGGSGYMYFDSIDDGMLYQGDLLERVYISNGYKTLYQIQSKYCPGNTKWASNILGTTEKYATKLYKIMTE